ncbi:MAG: putative helicase HelY [Acidimicrobiaceae bacterium]|nr:MAG: putative helicase HelY [Acidimicrobiaceae bacterium]
MNINFPYKLDHFQKEAIKALDASNSVLVTAPTSSGKTFVAEYAIEKALEESKHLYYTAPIKALCNQKFRDFSNQFGEENVGLLTGDHSIRSDSKVLVMTTEVLRNMLYSPRGAPEELRYVVLDEIHFLEDPYRGAVWEEIILTLPKNVLIVALSATVSNADELKDWITSVRGNIEKITRETRPVPLKGHFFAVEKSRNHQLTRIEILKNGKPNSRGQIFSNARRGRGKQNFRRWTTPRRSEIVAELKKLEMLPAIYFIFSRKGCDEARDSMVRYVGSLNNIEEGKKARKYAEERFALLTEEEKRILRVDLLLEGLEKGFASHHAGLLPLFKQTIEELFSLGLLKLVFATETLAVGVNLPARSVVIEKLTKFNGESHELLKPSQFTQLTGRAGRRGIDVEGHSFTCWSPFVPFNEVADLLTSKEFALISAFTPTYNMLANLLSTRSESEAAELLANSFAQFQWVRNTRNMNSGLIQEVQFRRNVLEATGLADGWSLTETGMPLTKIFNESDLLVTRAISDGILDGLPPEELAALVSCFIFRSRGKEKRGKKSRESENFINESIKELMLLNDEIERIEVGFGIQPNTPPDPGFAKVVFDWVSGRTLSEVLTKELTGGEFVRNIRLSVDLLKQISNVAAPETAKLSLRTVELMERGVVSLGGEFESEVLQEKGL